MSTVLSSVISSVSTVLTTVTSSPSLPANAPTKNSAPRLTTTEIFEIAIGSVAFCLLVIILVYVLLLRRPHRKYQHPEDSSKVVDTLDSTGGGSVSKSYRDDWYSVSEHGGLGKTPQLTNQTQQSSNRTLVNSDPQYTYTKPSSFVNDYDGATTRVVSSLHNAQSSETTDGFEPATLLSAQPSYWNSPIQLAPLKIPEKPLLNPWNGKSSIKRKGSTQSSKSLDSGCETDDSVSLYSEASASTHSSTSSQETIIPPPVPPIPLHSTTPTQTTFPENVNVIVSAPRREEAIIKASPTTPLFTRLPTLKFNREEAADDTEIHNVAKLLYSRQSRVPQPNVPSRNSSIVSHIERSGSIRPAILPTGEEKSESYRPRYLRLKQNRSSHPSDFSAAHLRTSLVSMPSSQVGS